MDALVPMASQPTAMAARNWMLRRMMIETIRNDPDYNGGNYTSQPRMMKYAIAAYRIAIAGGTLGYQTLAPTAAKADKMVDDRLATRSPPTPTTILYQWEASHDYDPSAEMEKIEATLLAINAADDERNPPETGVTDGRDQAHQERPALSDPRQHRDARPPHHRQCGVLPAAIAGIAADRAAADDVRGALMRDPHKSKTRYFAPHQFAMRRTSLIF